MATARRKSFIEQGRAREESEQATAESRQSASGKLAGPVDTGWAT